MAVTEQRQLYNPQIEALATQYGTALGKIGADPFTQAEITGMAPSVVGQTALQQEATARTTAGLGAYSPYVTAAGQAGTAAGTALGQAGTQLGVAEAGLAGIAPYAAQTVQDLAGAQQTLGGVSPYIGAAGTGLAGAGTTLGTAGTELTGAGTAMGGAQQYITQAAGLTGPMTGQQQTD